MPDDNSSSSNLPAVPEPKPIRACEYSIYIDSMLSSTYNKSIMHHFAYTPKHRDEIIVIGIDEAAADATDYTVYRTLGRDGHTHYANMLYIDAEYEVVEDKPAPPLPPPTSEQLLEQAATEAGHTTIYSREQARAILADLILRSHNDYIPIDDFMTTLGNLNFGVADDSDINGSRHKWYYGLERQLAHKVPRSQRAPRSKQHRKGHTHP